MSKIPFTWQTGIVDKNTVNLTVFTRSNSAVSILVNNIVVDSNLTLVARGTDGNSTTDSMATIPIVLWTGNIQLQITGRATLQITQDGVTRKGSTNSDLGDVDSQVIVLSCDAPNSFDPTGIGGYKGIKAYAQNPASNIQNIIHTDDHGYTDALQVDDTGTSGSGLFAGLPQVDWTEYSRYAAYCAYLGLLETDVAGAGYVPEFQAEERIWCRENIPTHRLAGDHELTNDPESDASITSAQIATSKNAFVNCIAATETFLNLSNSAAWIREIGPVEFIAIDRAFAFNGLEQIYNPTLEANDVTKNTFLSAAQITDIKAGVNATSPFKILLMSTSAKHISDASLRLSEKPVWTQSAWFGGQQPIHDYTGDQTGDTLSTVSEWRSLMTDVVDGICKQAQDYGAPIFGVHGDTHRPYEYSHFYPADDNNVELDFRECSCGAINTFIVQRLHPSITEGYYYRGTSVDWLCDWTEQNPPSLVVTPEDHATYIILDMKKGSDITVKYMRSDNEIEQELIHETVIERESVFTTNINRRLGSM